MPELGARSSLVVIIARFGYWEVFSELAAMAMKLGDLWEAVRQNSKDKRRAYDYSHERHWRT
jgi:hypothetical protein